MAGGDDMRFADAELRELRKSHEQLVEWAAGHEKKENEWRDEQGAKFQAVLDAQLQNTQAIGDLTGQVSELVSDTKDIVQLHKDFQGVARLGSGLQQFMVWLLKWGAIGSALAGGLHYILTHVKH